MKKNHSFKLKAQSDNGPYASHQNAKNTIFEWQFGTALAATHARSNEKVKSGT